MKKPNNRAYLGQAFLAFSIVFTLGYLLLVFGGGIYVIRAAIHLSLVVMFVWAPATAALFLALNLRRMVTVSVRR